MNESISRMADYVILQLKAAGFRIQRYDSYTTSSIYLKLDFGVCNSIRISDHKGKKGLHYRFNLTADRKKIRIHNNSGFTRIYYGFQHVDDLITDVLEHRSDKVLKYGLDRYKSFMVDNRLKNNQSKGFWSQCYEVN